MRHNQQPQSRPAHTSILWQASLFFSVGLVATGVHLIVALLIVSLAETGALAANTGGYCIAFFVSYLGHSRISFRREINRRFFRRFLLINTALFITSVLVSYALDELQFNSYIGVISTVGILPPLSFLMHKFVTFREHKSPGDSVN